MPPELHSDLARLDSTLLDALSAGDIRLVRSEWLLAQSDAWSADGCTLPRRQMLEMLERLGRASPSPLLSPEEACTLVRSGSRGVGVFSYPHGCPGDPDPTGSHLRALQAVLAARPYLEAVFWDFLSLYQHGAASQRTPREEVSAQRAREAMSDLYASALGTTVLQHREVPPRPAALDGVLFLSDTSAWMLRDDSRGRDMTNTLRAPCEIDASSYTVNEAAIRAALSRFGPIVEVRDYPAGGPSAAVVRFGTHAAALDVARAGAELPALIGRVRTLYNEISYDGNDGGRGWCLFEAAASGELITRLGAYPHIRSALNALPPKVLLLRTDLPPEPMHADSLSTHVESRVFDVVDQLSRATFTSVADKRDVPQLYRAYAARIAKELEGALARHVTTADHGSSRAHASGGGRPDLDNIGGGLPPLPRVDAPPAAPLRLEAGQLLLVIMAPSLATAPAPAPASAASASSGCENELHFGVVDASGTRASFPISSGEGELSFDSFSQIVYPWRPEAFETNFLATVLAGGLDNDHDHEPTPEETEAAAIQALRTSGALGLRRYQQNQWLSVWHKGGWRDGQIRESYGYSAAEESGETSSGGTATEHLLCFERGAGMPLDRPVAVGLHPWNHAPRELPAAAFDALRLWWASTVREKHSHTSDALVGKQLHVLKQCFAVRIIPSHGSMKSVCDPSSLSHWLVDAAARLRKGRAAKGPTAALLLTAAAAAGKTTLISQVVSILLLESPELVPIVIHARALHAHQLAAPERFSGAWNWVDAYLAVEHSDRRPELYRFLRQALMARRCVLLVDGLDEADEHHRAAMEAHITEVLAPQGHVLLCTSRPTGVDMSVTGDGAARFGGLRRLALAPLSYAQQHRALEQRLGSADAATRVREYASAELPRDAESGECVTASPLMLSIISSIFELRRGVDMPKTVAEVYELACKVMLARGGGTSPTLTRLLWAILFEAHVAQRCEINETHLDEAALGLEMPEQLATLRSSAGDEGAVSEVRRLLCADLSSDLRNALEELRTRALRDEAPLLHLLRASPLTMQARHLSVQEYAAARALCEEGTVLEGAPPWQWSVWWANVLAIGTGMGDGFWSGLLRSAGATPGGALDLSSNLGGHRPTVHVVILHMSNHLKSLNLASNALGLEGVSALAAALPRNVVLTALNLEHNSLPDEGGFALAEALKSNKTLTSLNLARNCFSPRAGKAFAAALHASKVLRDFSVAGNTISGEAAQQLAVAAIGSKSLEVFSGVPIRALRKNELRELCLSRMWLGPAEGLVLVDLLARGSAKMLRKCDLTHNALGTSVMELMRDAVAERRGFELLEY